MSRIRLVTLTLIGCLFTCTSAHAQNIYASLTGTVTDQSGAVMPGATITALNVDTGFKRSAVSDARGDYLLLQLPIGNYTITAEGQGFRTEARAGIVLQVDQRARADFKLQVGATTETVQVTASAPLVQSETSAIGQVINNTQVIELPLNGRNFNQLPLIVVGAQPAPPVGTTASGFSTGGARGNMNNYLLDGVDNQEPGVITVSFSPSVEMIQEFKLDQNAYSAELGRYSGAQINVSTKSGTNRFHGSLFEFIRNDKLDAKNFFDSPTTPKPALKRNQFGASIGGPIIKDKTHFFFVWESTKLRQALTGRTAVPTEAFLRGDFSALLVQGNPYSSAVQGRPIQLVHPTTRVPFANNQIPANLFDPVGVKIAAIYPRPNLSQANSTVNFLSNPVLINDPNQWSIRGDHRFSNKDSVLVRYSRNTAFASDPFASPGNQTVIPGYAQLTDSERLNGVVSYTRVISANVVNEVRLGYTKLWNNIRPTDPTTNAAAALGITQLDPNAYLPQYSGTPTINVSGFGGIGYPAPIPQSRVNNTFQIINNLSWTKGSHALKFGLNLLQFQIYQALNGNLRGTFTFSGQFSAGLTSGFGIADVLLGFPSAVSRFILTGPNPRNYQIHDTHGFYAQDDWKVTSKLTLNLGMRYELDLPVYYKGGQMASFNPKLGVIQIPSTVRSDLDPRRYTFPTRIPVPIQTYEGSRLCQTDKNNLAPRAGFAYRPFNDNKTSVRGGYGIFYNIDPFNSTCGSGTMLWRFTQSSNPIGATAPPTLTLANPFPAAVLGAALPLDYNVPELHLSPYMQQWNLSVERELKPSLVGEVRYVGSKGAKLPVTLNINQAVLGAGAVATRRPFASLGLTGNITGTAYAAASNYHALSLRVEKRMSNGLSFLAGYTWSKAIDTSGGLVPQNSLNLSADRGLATFDMRHRFISSYTWELPFGKGQRFGKDLHPFLNVMAGGWQFSGIFVTNSGTALTPVVTGDISLTGGGADRPNILRNPNLDNPAPERWFDTTAFAVATNGQFGNAGRGVIAGPGATNLDFSFQKYFSIREGHRLQFRAEMFNAFNHPNFLSPNLTANSPLFGRVTSAQPGRQMQLALRYSF
jgi:hypothetical protein